MQIERPDLAGRLRRHLGKQSRHQKIHRIPDPVAAQDPVSAGQQCHRRAAGETTFYSRGNRINLDRQRRREGLRGSRAIRSTLSRDVSIAISS